MSLSRAIAFTLSSRAAFVRPVAARSIHTSRVSLGGQTARSPIEEGESAVDSSLSTVYQKQEVGTAEVNGQTYVVSEAEPSSGKYDVPPGPYPTSGINVNFANTELPDTLGQLNSSTSPTPAHPTLTKRVPHNESGVGESAAVRHTEAPGEMGARRGGDGGLGLMDEATTRPGEEGELPEVNEAPIFNVERKAKLGNKEGWKERR